MHITILHTLHRQWNGTVSFENKIIFYEFMLVYLYL